MRSNPQVGSRNGGMATPARTSRQETLLLGGTPKFGGIGHDAARRPVLGRFGGPGGGRTAPSKATPIPTFWSRPPPATPTRSTSPRVPARRGSNWNSPHRPLPERDRGTPPAAQGHPRRRARRRQVRPCPRNRRQGQGPPWAKARSRHRPEDRSLARGHAQSRVASVVPVALLIADDASLSAAVAGLLESKRFDYALRVAPGNPHRVSADSLHRANGAVSEEEPEVNLIAGWPNANEHDGVRVRTSPAWPRAADWKN
jgi:hypothetical protein